MGRHSAYTSKQGPTAAAKKFRISVNLVMKWRSRDKESHTAGVPPLIARYLRGRYEVHNVGQIGVVLVGRTFAGVVFSSGGQGGTGVLTDFVPAIHEAARRIERRRMWRAGELLEPPP